MADDLSTYWKDLPSRETPLDARTLNAWGGLVEERSEAATSAAEAASAAVGYAQSAAQATDAVMAARINDHASLTSASVRRRRGAIANGTDLNTLRGWANDGLWSVSSNGAVPTMVNAPAENTSWQYTLDVRATTTGITTQTIIPYGSGLAMYMRAYANGAGTAWTPWRRLAWSDEIPAPLPEINPARHEDLLARFRQRRGGRIGTGGKAAVALRFDHHLNAFMTKVLPLLEEYHLPWAQAVNAERVGVYDTDSDVSFVELQDAALRTGGEVWNHGGNHEDATTEPALVQQIVGAKAALAVGLPGLAIEGWAPPGLPEGAYMGAALFRTVEENTATTAGRLIWSNHALVAGYADGRYRALDPSVQPIGATHATIEQHTPAEVAGILNAAAERSAGVALMLHPARLDEPGYMSTSQLAEAFADIAARRDAGTLMVLSYSGLWAADVTTSYRHDLVPVSARSPGASRAAGVTHSTTASADLPHRGAPRELVFTITAATAGNVAVEVTGLGTTTAPLVTGVNIVRRFITPDLTATTALALRATCTVPVTVNEVHLYAV